MAKFTREEIEEEIKISRKLLGADLEGVDLRDADLGEANLSEADLAGADLQEADLSGANLGGAEYNKYTQFPDGFDPEEAEMVFFGG